MAKSGPLPAAQFSHFDRLNFLPSERLLFGRFRAPFRAHVGYPPQWPNLDPSRARRSVDRARAEPAPVEALLGPGPVEACMLENAKSHGDASLVRFPYVLYTNAKNAIPPDFLKGL